MPAYLIACFEITDLEGFKPYSQRVPQSLEAFGGRYLVRGGPMETVEGDFEPKRFVVLEFPDMKSAKAWYASPAYQEILPLRCQNSRARFFTFVEGYAG